MMAEVLALVELADEAEDGQFGFNSLSATSLFCGGNSGASTNGTTMC